MSEAPLREISSKVLVSQAFNIFGPLSTCFISLPEPPVLAKDQANMKGLTDTVVSDESIQLANTPTVNKKHGTQRDERDMERMGKRQQLRVRSRTLRQSCKKPTWSQRQFKFLTIYGFGVVLGCTWEYALMYVPNSTDPEANWHIFKAEAASPSTTEDLLPVYGCSSLSVSACYASPFPSQKWSPCTPTYPPTSKKTAH